MTESTPTRVRTSVGLGRVVSVADQLVWSAANVVLVSAAARSLTTSEFGTFSAALLIGLIALAVARSFVTEPLMLGADSGNRAAADVRGQVLGASVLLGAPLALAGAVLVIWFDGALDPTLAVAFVLACWSTVAQDAVRFVAIAHGRPGAALTSDAAWLTVSVGWLVWTLGDRSAATADAVAIWAMAAVIGLIAGMLALGAVPRVGGAAVWIRSHAALGWRLAADASAGVIAANASLLLVGVVAGPDELAGLRGAYLFLGPMNAITEGLYLAMVPGLSRRTASGSSIMASVVRLGVGLTVSWTVFAVAVLALPSSWKAAVLGDTWTVAEPVIPWLLVASIVGAVAISATYGVRAWRDARSLVRVRGVLLPWYLVVLPLAAWWNGAVGYASVLVGVAVLQLALYGGVFVRTNSRGSQA